jgi:hypothetical protein
MFRGSQCKDYIDSYFKERARFFNKESYTSARLDGGFSLPEDLSFFSTDMPLYKETLASSSAIFKNTTLVDKAINSIISSEISKTTEDSTNKILKELNKEGDVYYKLPDEPLDWMIHGDKTELKEFIQNFR